MIFFIALPTIGHHILHSPLHFNSRKLDSEGDLRQEWVWKRTANTDDAEKLTISQKPKCVKELFQSAIFARRQPTVYYIFLPFVSFNLRKLSGTVDLCFREKSNYKNQREIKISVSTRTDRRSPLDNVTLNPDDELKKVLPVNRVQIFRLKRLNDVKRSFMEA